MMSPRSVFEIPRHSGELKAFRAALTAASTSSAEAASTEVISDSSLRGTSVMALGRNLLGAESTYLGLTLVIFSPELDLTNSLLMNKPVGKVIFVPLGAVKSTERFDIVTGVKSLKCVV